MVWAQASECFLFCFLKLLAAKVEKDRCWMKNQTLNNTCFGSAILEAWADIFCPAALQHTVCVFSRVLLLATP